jgi:hypothetical protein
VEFAGLKVAVGLPPIDSFAGHAYDLAEALIRVAQSLGARVMTVGSEEWDDPSRRSPVVARLERFDAELAIAMPQTGYALRFRDSDGRNLFSDVLGLRLALPWDHLLTQAPMYYLPAMHSEPQRAGALRQLREGLRKPLTRHYVPDSAHIATYSSLGIIESNATKRYMPSADEGFLAAGKAPLDKPIADRVAFAGNTYSSYGSKLKLLEHDLIRSLDAALNDEKCRRWGASAWSLLQEQLERIPLQVREQNGLTPDFPLFWWIALDLLSYRVGTAYRLHVLNAIGRGVDYYGNYVDPESTSGMAPYERLRFCGSVPYAELPQLFRRYAVWVDVTSVPFINGCGAKVFNCFAAGSFMLMDFREDVRSDVGELADAFMYRNAEDLNEKISFYLTHPRERDAVTQAMQEQIRSRFTWKAFYARIMGDMTSETRASQPVGA